VVRISSSLSALTKAPVRIHSIRAGRPKPGLAAQHLAGIQLVAALCSGSLSGDGIGSVEVRLSPGDSLLQQKEYLSDAKTAGATSLLLQSSLPVCSFPSSMPAHSKTKLTLKGGTNVPFSPQFEYVQHVLLPNLRKLVGLEADVKLIRRGVFPKGGGVIEASVTAKESVEGFDVMERGKVTGLRGFSWACGGSAESEVEKMSLGVREELSKAGGDLRGAEVAFEKSVEGKGAGKCYGTVLWATTESGMIIGASSLAGKGTDPLSCGASAASELIREVAHGGCVDCYMQDQVIVFMSLSPSPSQISCGPITQHTRTAIHFAQLLTGATFTVTEGGGLCTLHCSGKPGSK